MDKLNLPPFEATLNAAGKTSGNAPSTVGNGHYRKEKLGNLLPRPRFLLQITGSSLPCGAFLPANTLPTLPIARFPVRAGHLPLRATVFRSVRTIWPSVRPFFSLGRRFGAPCGPTFASGARFCRPNRLFPLCAGYRRWQTGNGCRPKTDSTRGRGGNSVGLVKIEIGCKPIWPT